MNLSERLLKIAGENKLGHFYIVEGPQSLGFVHEFIKDYYHKLEGHKQTLENLNDHPDVFILGNLEESTDPKEGNFSVEEAQGLTRFLEFKAIQSKRKFIVVTEAHRVGQVVANKWLKSLEEPVSECTIFLLNPRRQKLLDTIHSRAVHLRIPSPPIPEHPEQWASFLADAKNLSMSSFLEKYSKSTLDLNYWTNELVCHEQYVSSDFSVKNSHLEWLKLLKEMETFHQPSATKWSLFYSHLQEHVLNHLNH